MPSSDENHQLMLNFLLFLSAHTCFRIEFESIVLAGFDGLIQVDGFDGVNVFKSIAIIFESKSNRIRIFKSIAINFESNLFESIVLADVDGLIQVDDFDSIDVFESNLNRLFWLVLMV